MAIYTQGGVGPSGTFLQDFETSFTESLGATAEEAWRGSYWKTWQQAGQVRLANEGGRGLSYQEAEQRIKAAGLAGQLEPVDGISERGLGILVDRKWAEVRTADVLSRAKAGAVGEQSVARFVTGLGVGIMDPVNVAAAFFPASWLFRGAGLTKAAIATERLAHTAKHGGSLGARLGAAAGVGAIEGGVGTAVLEPFYMATRKYLQDDYDMADSLINVAAGGIFGGGLHTTIRGIGEIRSAYSGRSPVADVPVLTERGPADSGASIDASTPGGGGPRGGVTPALEGSSTSVRFGPDLAVEARYAVVEAEQLQALVDKGDAQYRDRTRAAYQAELQQRVNALDFEFLHAFPGADHGAPVLTAGGGPIVAGNGRTLLIQRAYEAGTGVDRYKRPLVARAAEFGLDPARLEAMDKPVLVRILQRDVDVRRAAQLSNEAGATPMSALELAKVDAERLGDLRGIEVTETGSLRTAGNRGLMRRWLEQQPENQRNALVDRDGYLSAAGLRRVQNAILFRAFGDTPMLGRLVESADPGARNVIAGLTRAAAAVAEGRAAVARGELHALDLVPDLEAAVQTYADLRDRGVNVADWLANGELVDGLSPAARRLVAWFDEHARSPRAIADVVEGFYRQLERRGAPGQGDMFGGTAKPSVDELLDAAIAEAEAVLAPASAEIEEADPAQRSAAARAAVVQVAQGKPVDVAEVITGTPADVVSAAERSAAQGSMLGDPLASQAVPEAPKDARSGAALEDANAALAEAMKLAKQTLDAGEEAWKYARFHHGTPAQSFGEEPGAPFGRFRWKFMSSGEGAQAFGYGHYVAERESLARERYRDGLIERRPSTSPVTFWRYPFAFDYSNVDAASLTDFLTYGEHGGFAGAALFEFVQEPGAAARLAAAREAFAYVDQALRADPHGSRGEKAVAAIKAWRADHINEDPPQVFVDAVAKVVNLTLTGDARRQRHYVLPDRRVVSLEMSNPRRGAGGMEDQAALSALQLIADDGPNRARIGSMNDMIHGEKYVKTARKNVADVAAQVQALLDEATEGTGWQFRIRKEALADDPVAAAREAFQGLGLLAHADAVSNKQDSIDTAEALFESKAPGRKGKWGASEWREFREAVQKVGGTPTARMLDAQQASTRLFKAVQELAIGVNQQRFYERRNAALQGFTEVRGLEYVNLSKRARGADDAWAGADPSEKHLWTNEHGDALIVVTKTRERLESIRDEVGNDPSRMSAYDRQQLKVWEDQVSKGAVYTTTIVEADSGVPQYLAAADEAEAIGIAREAAKARAQVTLAAGLRELESRDVVEWPKVEALPGEPELSAADVQALRSWLEVNDPKRIARRAEVEVNGRRVRANVTNQGSVFTVEIPDEAHARMARWDDLLSEDAQPESVMQAVRKLMTDELVDAVEASGIRSLWKEAAGWRGLLADVDEREDLLMERADRILAEEIKDSIRSVRNRGHQALSRDALPQLDVRDGFVLGRPGRTLVIEAPSAPNEFGVYVSGQLDQVRVLLDFPDTISEGELRAAIVSEREEAIERWKALNNELAGLKTHGEQLDARLKRYEQALMEEKGDNLGDYYEKARLHLLADVGGEGTFESWYRWLGKHLEEGPIHEALVDDYLSSAATEIERRRDLSAGAYGDDMAGMEANGEELLSVVLHQLGVPGHLFADGFTRRSTGAKTYNAVLYGDDVGQLVDRYARGGGVRTPAERLHREVARAFGKEGRRLLETGRVEVVETVKDLPGSGHPDDVMAATAPDGTVYLVASNVGAHQVRGLVLHEVGVHAGMERMVGREAFGAILEQVDRLLEKGDADVMAARLEVPADTPAHLVPEETLAYLVQQAPEVPLVRRLVAAVRAWAVQTFPGLTRRFKLTTDDLRALALAALEREARGGPLAGRNPRLRPSGDDGGDDVPQGQQLAYARDPAGPRKVEDELRALDELVERAKAYRSALQAAAGVAEDRRAEVMRAVLPDLTPGEITTLLDELKRANVKVRGSLRSLRDQLQAEDVAAELQDDALKAADQAANNLEMAAVIRKRGEALNLAARARGLAFVTSQFDRFQGEARGRHLAEGFMAMLGGTEHRASGARASAALEQQQFQAKWAGGLIHDLEKAGLWDVFVTDAVALDTAKALEAFGTAKGTEGLDKRAIAIAKIVRKYQEDARVTRNRFGAWIRELRGYVTRQSHDQDKIYAAGAGEWGRFVAERIDPVRTFGREGMSQREIVDALAQLWQDFSSGNHTRFSPDEETQLAFSGPANLARRVSQSRELWFKDATAFWQYHQQFGNGGFAGAVVEQMLSAARGAGLLKVLGTNPEAQLDRMMDEVSSSLIDDPLARRRFDAERQRVKDLLRHVDGSTNIPGSEMGALVGAVTRGLSALAKLGGAVISSVTDVPVYGAAVRSAGGGLFEGMGKAIGSLFEGRSTQARKDTLSALGVYFDSMIGGTIARFDADGRYPGWMTRAMQFYFKVNLLTPWTERLRTSAALTFSHMLGLARERPWAELDESLRARLEALRFDEARWNVVRLAALKEADGRMYLTPEGMRAVPQAALENYLALVGREVSPTAIANLRTDLADNLRAFFIDMAHHAVVEPDVRTRHWMLRGTQPGTVAGELLRFIGQFKAFPVAMTRMVLGREVYGRGYDTLGDFLKRGRGDVLALVELMLVMTAFGYGAMTAKDLLKGRKPRSPFRPETWTAAFAQGGGLGIYGDFLFGEMRNRYGGGLTDTLAGPVVGTAADVADLYGRWKAGDHTAAAALRLAVNQTPFINVFYLRFALDYLLLYRLQEAVNPGYLRRMEGRVKKDNDQEFWLRPSEVVR